MIELSKIRTDGGTQSRSAICEETVAEYAEAMADPDKVFPPIVVYHDGKEYWLADGFHRIAAWKRIGRPEVPAEVRQGDRRRAILHSCGANAAHGLRRTNEDKRRAVLTLLEDEEWSQWSDRQIARQCGVSHEFVRKLRAPSLSTNDSEPRTYTNRHGTEAQMDTSRIGKTAPTEQREPVHKPANTSAADSAKNGAAEASSDPAPAQPEAMPEADPESGPAPDPYDYADLTHDALLDTANGLRADWEDMRKRVEDQREQIASLKAEIAQLTEGDTGRTIGNLQRRLSQSEGRSKEHQAKAARLQRRVNAQTKEIADLRRQLAAQEIPL